MAYKHQNKIGNHMILDFVFHPPTQIPISHWRSTGILLKCFCEVRKTKIIGDEGERFIAITEEAFCFLFFYFHHEKITKKNKFLSNTCNLTRKVIK